MKNKLSLRHKILLISAAASLLLGLVNYFLFQSNISFFSFFSIHRQNIFETNNHFIHLFLTGYFSDIAWCSALYMVAVVLSEKGLLHFFSKMLILVLPFAFETAQYTGLLGGTFDWFDLLVYLIIVVLFIFFFPTLIHKK